MRVRVRAGHTAGAASVAVRAPLTGPPRPATVVLACPTAVYLELAPLPGDGPPTVVALLTSDAVALPLGVRLATPSARTPFASVAVGAPALVGAGRVELADLGVLMARWWDPGVRARVGRTAHAARERVDAALALLPAPPGELRAAVEDLAARGPGAVPERLVGLGPGLTPAGDDLLCGALAASHGFGEGGSTALLCAQVRRLSAHTSLLSGALLRAAADGYAFRELLSLLAALCGDGSDVVPPLKHLFAVGATSGTEIARGALLTLSHLARVRDAEHGEVA